MFNPKSILATAEENRLANFPNPELSSLANIETLLERNYFAKTGLRLTADEVRELWLRLKKD